MSRLLREPVERFVDDLTPELERLAASLPAPTGKARQDVALEAFNLAAAVMDSDGLHTDDELLALIETFGPHLETVLGMSTPGDVRRAGLLRDKAAWIEEPSLFFEVLVADDNGRGTNVSWRYYEAALAVAHAVCSLDDHPSHVELAAVERFRSMLLKRMEHWEVGRPGANRPQANPAVPRPLDELLAELDALVGLAEVKAEVKLVADLLSVQKLRRERGLPVVEGSRHLVFTGTRARARPPSPASWPRSTEPSGWWRKGTWSRPTAPAWWRATWGRRRSTSGAWSKRPSAACC